MTTIRNPTDDTLVIPGVPAFAPGEERAVSDAEAARLTNGTPLVVTEEVKQVVAATPPTPSRKPKKPHRTPPTS